MRNILLGAASALALVPGVASAALVLSVPDITIDVPSAAQTVNVDVFFSEVSAPNDTTNEQLAGFAVRVDLAGNGAGTTVHLPTARPNRVAQTPVDPSKPYIFALAGENSETGEPAIERPAIPDNSDAYGPTNIVQAALSRSGGEADIVANNSVVRIPIVIEPNAAPGVYTLTLDRLVTSFSDGTGAAIAVTLDDGSITITPEPASLGLLAMGGLFALRRRRMA